MQGGGARVREQRVGGVVNLFANRVASAIAIAFNASLDRALDRGYRCLVHYDTERAKENRERWIGTCRDGKGMKFPPFTMSAINGRTALHPLQVSRFVGPARRERESSMGLGTL